MNKIVKVSITFLYLQFIQLNPFCLVDGQEIKDIGSFTVPALSAARARSYFKPCQPNDYRSKWKTFTSRKSFDSSSVGKKSKSCLGSGNCKLTKTNIECIQHPKFNEQLYIVSIPGIFEQKVVMTNCKNPGKKCEKKGKDKNQVCTDSLCIIERVLLFQPPANYYYSDLEVPNCACKGCKAGADCGPPTKPPPPPLGECDVCANPNDNYDENASCGGNGKRKCQGLRDIR